jgi:hypothetical protein
MEKIAVSAIEVAKMIMLHHDAVLSQNYISVNEDGRLYYAQEAEPVGDDAVILDFRGVDVESNADVNSVAEWLRDVIEPNENGSGMTSDGETFIWEWAD